MQNLPKSDTITRSYGAAPGVTAAQVVNTLGLSPHPEGGWFRETWRDTAEHGTRSQGTAILYLLERHQRSHWHRVDATELWLHQGGGALRLLTLEDARIAERRLGPDLLGGDLAQAIVRPGEWQSAESMADWTLVSCVVVPGFEAAGFELAPAGWEPTPARED